MYGQPPSDWQAQMRARGMEPPANGQPPDPAQMMQQYGQQAPPMMRWPGMPQQQPPQMPPMMRSQQPPQMNQMGQRQQGMFRQPPQQPTQPRPQPAMGNTTPGQLAQPVQPQAKLTPPAAPATGMAGAFQRVGPKPPGMPGGNLPSYGGVAPGETDRARAANPGGRRTMEVTPWEAAQHKANRGVVRRI